MITHRSLTITTILSIVALSIIYMACIYTFDFRKAEFYMAILQAIITILITNWIIKPKVSNKK